MKIKQLIFLFLLMLFQQSGYSQLPYFTSSITESQGLSSNYIKTMAWDGANRLWIGTDRGINIYDGHRFAYLNGANGLIGSYINQLLYDSMRQVMLIVTSNKMLYYSDGQTLTHVPLAKGYHVSSVGISNSFYQVIAEAPGNRTAFFAFPSIETLQKQKPLLELANDAALDLSFGAGREIIARGNGAIHISYNQLKKQAPVRPGTLYSSAAFGQIIFQDGMVEWELTDGKAKIKAPSKTGWVFGASLSVDSSPAVILHAPNTGSLLCLKKNGESLFLPDSISKLSAITDVLEGPDNSILIGTLGDGLIICYPSKGKMLLPGKHVIRIANGSNNVDWLVADDQLYRYDHHANPVPTGITINEATSITEQNGFLHCTSLLQYQRLVLNKDQRPKLVYSKGITAGVSDFAWIPGTGYELSTYSLGTVLFSEDGNSIDTLSVEKGTLHDNIIENIFHLSNGQAFTSFSNGVLIKPNTGKQFILNEKAGLISNTVYAVGEERRGKSLWICSENGITRFENKIYKKYGHEQGFVGKKCLYFFIDKLGRRFAVSDVCLMQINDDKLLPLLSFPIKTDPFATVSTVFYDDETDLLDIGSSEGLFELEMSKVHPDRTYLKPSVYYVRTADTVINNIAQKVIVPAGSNTVEIVCGFEEVDFAGNAKLYYKLEGISDEWLPVPANFSITIPKLPAGIFELKMYSINADGFTGKPEMVLTINKLYPWYLSKPLRILYALIAVLLMWLGAHVWVSNKIRQRIQHLLIGEQLQRERNRISSELHDNVGSQLTNIIAQLDYVEGSLHHHNTEAAMQKVVGLQLKARQAMNQLRESIWVLKEDAVKLPAFVGRVHRYALEIFDEHGQINFEIDSRVKKEVELTPWQAVNLLRVLQEGFQNIQKHSEASRVHLTLTQEFEHLKMVLSDNGKGFDTHTQLQHGQGLDNMQRRVKDMNGNFRILSRPGRGTKIIIEIPVSNN